MKTPKVISQPFGLVSSYRMQIRKRSEFEHTVYRAVIGAVIMTLVLSFAKNFIGGTSGTIQTILIGAGGLLWSLFRECSWKRIAGITIWLAALTSIALYLLPQSFWNLFTLGCLLFVPIFANGQSVKKLCVQSIFSGSVLVSGFEAVKFFGVGNLLPHGQLVESILLGGFVGVALLANYIEITDNRMIRSLACIEKRSELRELAELATQTISLHQKIVQNLAEIEDSFMIEVQPKVDALVRRISNSCERAHQLEKELKELSLGTITENIEMYDSKLKETSNPKVAAMLKKARSTTLEQNKLLEKLFQAKEEATAKALIDVTLLERLRIALLQLRGAHLNTSAPGPEFTDVIEELSAEIEATCDAVEEVFQEQTKGQAFFLPALHESNPVNFDAVCPEIMIRK